MRIGIGRSLVGFAAIWALLAAFGASSALAARSYDSEITGVGNPSRLGGTISSFQGPTRIGIEANDQVRITSRNNLYKYNAYPSQTLIGPEPNLIPAWSYSGQFEFNLAVDNATGELFVAEGGRTLYPFDHNNVAMTPWDTTHGLAGVGFFIAIDNSNTLSQGRLYLSFTSPEDDIEVFDNAQRPVDFPATASYITENKLTGTPSGPFGKVGYVAVDAAGNLYVVDQEKAVVDEFDSSGTFIREFTGEGAPEGFTPPPGHFIPDAVAVDPTNGNILIETENRDQFKEQVDEFDSSGNYLGQLTSDSHGELGSTGPPGGSSVGQGDLRLNSHGYLYLASTNQEGSVVDIYTPNPPVPNATYKSVSAPSPTSGTLNATIDPNGGGKVSSCHFEYGTSSSYGLGTLPCQPATHFAATTDVSAELTGLSTETTYHYRVIVEDANGVKYGADQTYTPHGVVGLRTEAATELSEASAQLNASFTGNGYATHYYFEWGPTATYGHQSAEALVSPGPGSPEALSATLSGLAPYSTYHYRIVASNGAGTSDGDDQLFTTSPGIPSVTAESASQVHSDRAVLAAQINPNGADTTYHFEYVDDEDFQQSGFANATSTGPALETGVGRSKHFQVAKTPISGLAPGTLFHYRAVATNQAGVGTAGVDRTFTTFPFGFKESCPNSHARQQTGSALLLDCRAYELASAANAGGYDVESDLTPGQEPFGSYPQATGPSQLLYGVHNGAIPGTANPVNNGVDPYVATRTEEGWKTEYVGIPANDPFASAPFDSTLVEADSSLDTLVFGGEKICSPCFEDHSKGTPIHLPNGELVQGMAGTIPQPSAEPAGYIGKSLSANGEHFVFGSTLPFESDGNEGEISIYDRNLTTETTHVISKTPGGATMSGPGIGELDLSANGSHILIGQLVSEEGKAKYWHLYMNVGDSGQTIDLTPGATHGVLYDGMTEDGSKVFFTAKDRLTGDDEDESTDLYEAEVSPGGATLSRISTGIEGSGNSNECEPTANTVYEHWNSAAGEEDCDVVAIGGGGGVAAANGTVYFLSPELLDGSSHGVQDAPNLYIARPGSAPHFVATLESSANAAVPPPAHPLLRSFGVFSNPAGIAVDHATGDVYVLEITNGENNGVVQKFTASGKEILDFGSSGKLQVPGALGNLDLPTGIAVDNDPGSPSHGDLYVPSPSGGVVKKFSPTGVHLGDIGVGGIPSGVAVDQANGQVYASSLFSSEVFVFSATGTPLRSFPTIFLPTGVAVDSSGRAYVVNGGGFFGAAGTTEVYGASGEDLEQLDGNPSKGVAVDPADDHVYVDEANRVVEFDPSGNQVGAPIGVGLLGSSFGLAADSGSVYVSNPSTSKVASFGPMAVPAEPRTDNPLVIDSVASPGVRHSADFEVTPSGNDAAFTSTLPLTEYDNAEVHREIFRYDSNSGINCASCNPTGEQASGEASLPANGLGLSDDGRVFFDSTEGLVDRDLNNKMDAYEWESGKGIDLISTGTSPLDSSLLGISADGTDAYFFTHDTLVPSDENGARVKVYDARALGGFPIAPPSIPCSASDECHGPSSQAPPPTVINTTAGTAVGNAGSEKPAKHHKPKHHHRKKSRHHKKASHRHGGGK